MAKREEEKSTDNSTVAKRLQRLDLRCSICPPNKGENASRKAAHGAKKPKYKDRRRGKA